MHASISTSLALHLRDAELGQLVCPTHEHDEDFTGLDEPTHATDEPATDDFDFAEASALWSTLPANAVPVPAEPQSPCAGLTASFFHSPTVAD